MNIITDEMKIAKKAIETGYIDDKKPSSTIKILIKYYRDEGMDKEQIRNQIENFMVKNYKDYNSSNWQDSLDRLVKIYFKDSFKLVIIKDIKITKNELDRISNLDNLKLEKLAFTLLVYAKILNQINDSNNNWVNGSNNVITKDADIKETGKSQKLLFKQLKDLEYIKYARMVNKTSMQVMYIDEKIDDESEIVIELTDFRDFILRYLEWKGENIKFCECGRPFKVVNNKIKYCKECSRQIRDEKRVDYNKNYYDKIKNK